MADLTRSEFILGGQRSGKSRRAEVLARQWLERSPDHRAVMVATGQAWDDEMRERIARHRRDRAERVPGLVTVEEPLALAEALGRVGDAKTLVVVDCLTLWMTNLMMPVEARQALDETAVVAAGHVLCEAIAAAPGPLVLVGNEIGLGVIPLGREVRAFVDALGRLNQSVAAACERVTLMAAGLPLTLKDKP
ncbi:bifunctional adenosylcobinamide kinase/adenosylcobinamide-phosphate guanylyltransferase [Hydrogenophaga taeniospiralis]|uniref:bifunctional adenosylcobinamide kinase/adenosylcobinamide-phosphate guanylyltransferase n=1 Tax=Hydrogenophaga taeniospiralis TaxID=65656 RepID=UPI001CFAF241|nr:bifunctional adenosylcobinamide kinase/adenosylcobinamide-phosphate guanylyltransferase [Hydrogenophaga taeniospiralis]UCU92080.1 bifunctional adenosylcobinamide kinase/adenosylcobinamide-phosphate guanylyltransferase [Hydrogenophaga taeniospiralis]